MCTARPRSLAETAATPRGTGTVRRRDVPRHDPRRDASFGNRPLSSDPMSPAATHAVEVGTVTFGGGAPLALIAGPCVIESREHALRHAAAIAAICRDLGVPLVFKSSYDKANRTSGSSFRGLGMDEGLKILAEVRAEIGVPVLTDIHEPAHAAAAAP